MSDGTKVLPVNPKVKDRLFHKIYECEEYLSDSCKRYYCKLGFIIGGGVIVYFLILLLIPSVRTVSSMSL